jgi:hypothetical protein
MPIIAIIVITIITIISIISIVTIQLNFVVIPYPFKEMSDEVGRTIILRSILCFLKFDFSLLYQHMHR